MTGEPEPKSHLLVTGVARSGTTAMGELLNSHSKICLGVERFKFQFLRANVFDPSLFERDRFFDFRPEDTNLDPEARPAWQPVYDRMAEKWDNATIVGDKVPDMMPVLSDFMRANPDFKAICLLRNLKDVALSWQARANRARDSWPAGKGFAVACASWEEQHKVLHDLMRDKSLREHVLLLDYDKIYENPGQTEAAILAFLGLAPEPEFTRILNRHAAFVLARKLRKVPKEYIDAYKAVDQSHVRGLRKVAREQLEIWSQQSRPQ
ncbi:sulfotransferase [Roseovarius aestuariivivens]|uniref:sulfotransferase n=1 Tax=Roseovarius aestuariivivens TaxID=1888910 RepID=UPI00107FECA2|nr:sulfotransferase [Roseovarius aestuariivivens]